MAEDESKSRDLTSISDLSNADPSALEQSLIEQVDEFAPIESSIEPPQSNTGTLDSGAPAEEESPVLTPKDNSAILVTPPEFAAGTPEFTIPGMGTQLHSEAIDNVREFSERLSSAKSLVPAAYPFSLLITGEMTKDEKDKLVDILSREKMGISEMELSSQLEGDHILVPRISEYAGVLIVQALRDCKATMRLAPADQVFATEDTLTQTDERLASSQTDRKTIRVDENSNHPAEELPITSANSIPDLASFSVIGVISATAALRSTLVEAEGSVEYQEVLEALQKELRYKAYYKHAIAILNFSSQLTTLHLPSQYRLTVTGTAIKAPNTQ